MRTREFSCQEKVRLEHKNKKKDSGNNDYDKDATVNGQVDDNSLYGELNDKVLFEGIKIARTLRTLGRYTPVAVQATYATL